MLRDTRTLLEKMGLARASLAGKVAIVTGAGQGIGKELARALAWLGAQVIIAEISDAGADVEALINSEDGKALFVKADVSGERSMRALADTAFSTFDKVDILVNNAAIEPLGSIMELPTGEWDRAYSVNVRGAVLGIKVFLPGMIERREGTIVTVASGEGLPYLAAYSASKVAVQSLALSLAAELGDDSGLSAFVLAPGMVDTPGFREAVPSLAPRYGMTVEEFTHQGVNPGYEGLMPAEDCAAGFAYVIVNAKEYHGQIADPFAPLMKFGLLPVTSRAGPEAGGEPALDQPAAGFLLEKLSYSKALECAAELEKILKTVNNEFNELGSFAKRWGLRDFQKKAGLSVKDWLQTATDVVTKLQSLSRLLDSGDVREAYQLRVQLLSLRPMLERLANYFHGATKDARGFIKDPDVLSSALEAIAHRERVVHSLISVLERINE